jgi:hypothetical protein
LVTGLVAHGLVKSQAEDVPGENVDTLVRSSGARFSRLAFVARLANLSALADLTGLRWLSSLSSACNLALLARPGLPYVLPFSNRARGDGVLRSELKLHGMLLVVLRERDGVVVNLDCLVAVFYSLAVPLHVENVPLSVERGARTVARLNTTLLALVPVLGLAKRQQSSHEKRSHGISSCGLNPSPAEGASGQQSAGQRNRY